MRAIQITRLDGPSAVELTDLPEPDAGDNVLVDVHVAGVSFPDVLLSRGEYQFKPETPFVPGSEVAGVVRQAPEGSGLTDGQRVAAFPFVGGFAETVSAAPTLVFPIPDETTFEAAAAIPMNYLTAHFALRRRARLEEGETVLVHGAAGGLGTASVQLATAFGARVVAVVSTEEKGEAARAAGADDVVLADGFKDAVKELTGGRGVDVVVDPVGGDRFTDSLRSLAPEGRLLVLGFTGGAIPEVKVNRLLHNNTSVLGVGWGAFWLGGDPMYPQQQWAEVAPLLAEGKVDPVLGSVHPLEEAAAALAEIDERRATGKVLLRVR